MDKTPADSFDWLSHITEYFGVQAGKQDETAWGVDKAFLFNY